ncbi:MAG: cytochrome c oxidase subunit II, partial [Rhodoferax sp.]|nr:cytochrome c oxidase subunit II [Rhodoferax sp.]
MKSIWNKAASPLAIAGGWFGTGSLSLAATVNDLPGGPAVLQLNLPPAVTAIAREQQWLHWFMLILCSVIFVAVFAVMFYSIWKHR